MKSSLILVALALCAVSAVYGSILPTGNKVGRCPSSTGFGICVMGCFADSDCQGVKKCCSNGCGRTCQTPSFVREGECPSNEGVVGICAINENSCLDDEQCDAGHKCCARGCNNECVRV